MSKPRLAAGTSIGPYEIVALLGQGGMGEVYRAKDLRLSREVAVKVLHGEVISDPERVRRFEHEARAAGSLSHPNIVAVHDTGQHDGSPYIVSELLQGETLRDRMATGSLGVRKSVEYGVQIARGLAAAHDKGIVHRDLKPENLFLTKDSLVKILDFGIAKLGRPGEEPAGTDTPTLSHTNPGTIMGTVGYMSPEQVRGQVADHRSDLFSFGTVLFEMVTGKRAFKGTTAADTLSAILREDPTEADGTASQVPPGLLRVVRRCFEKAPEDRFQTARDLAFALEGATTESRGASVEGRAAGWRRQRLPGTTALAALAAVGTLGLWAGQRWRGPAEPTSYQRLTFRLGDIRTARFAPDQETILYSAEWGGQPMEVFSTRATARGSRSLGIVDAKLLAVSAKEELALLLHPQTVGWWIHQGTLARAPLSGGTPREVLEDVIGADWDPEGRDLAVIHLVEGGRTRLEFPIGRVLRDPEPPRWISMLRVSPRGDKVAFFEHPVQGDNRGDVYVVDREGRTTTAVTGFTALSALSWLGDEIWVSCARVGGSPQQIRALTGSGAERIAVEVPGLMHLMDISRTGQLLIRKSTSWTETRARAKGAGEERELPAADLSFLSDLSDDGEYVLGTDMGGGSGPNSSFYLQRTDGSPPVWLGEGDGQALSPDGRSALALLTHTSPPQLLVVPTGAGEARVLDRGKVAQYQRAVWDPSGRRVVFSGAEREGSLRLFTQDAAGGEPRPVTPEGVELLRTGKPVSPDGRHVIAAGADGMPVLYPLAGGDPVAVPGLGESDVPIAWTPDGRELLVARYDDTPPRVERMDIATGRSRPWSGLGRATPSGLIGDYRLLVTPDGQAYAYGYVRAMSDLYLSSRVR